MARTPRSQPYRLQWPFNSDQLEKVDQMLQELYDDLRNDTIQVSVDQITGTLPVGSGGTGTLTTFTAGSVVFAGASGIYAQDQSNFFWDDTNNRLGIGTTGPNAALESLAVTEQLRLSYDATHYASFTVSSAGALTVAPLAGQNYNLSLSTTGDFAINTNQLYVDTSVANIGIGTSAFGASMVGGVAVKNGTAPTGNVTDVFQFYAADQTAGNAAPHFRTETGDVVKLYKTGTYTPTNVTPDRSFDANSTSLDELADVVGSLIADLQLTGLLG